MADRIKGITVEIGGDTTGLSKALSGVNKEIKSTQTQLKDVNKLLKLDPTNTTLLQQKQQLLKTAISETKDKLTQLKSVQDQMDEGLKNGTVTQQQYDAWQREIVETENELKNLQKELDNSSTAMTKMTAAGEKLQSVGDTISGVGKKMMPVTLGITALGTAAVSTAANFESAMSQVQATMGITKDSMSEVDGQSVNTMDTLTALAKEMGETTAFSATECAEALNYLALAGYDTQEMVDTLPTVLNLAAAGGMELATASDMVTDAMSALGMETSDADVMVDQMAKTASSTNTSVEQLGEGILKIGATARSVKGGTAELNTALGILANNGIKGAEGGTHLRNVILSLQEGCENGAIAVGDMSVQVYDAEGNMRSLNDILGDMNTAMDGMTAEEKNNIISKIFNKTDLASVNALLANTGDTWDDLQNSITNSAGAAQQMADTQLDNLQGQLTLLKSALEGLAISIGQILMPYIKSIVSHIQSFVDWLNNLDERTQKIIVTVALVVAAIGPVLIIVGKVISSVGTIMTIIPKVTSAMSTVKTAMMGLNATMAANPIGLVIVAITALVAAFIYLWNTNEDFRNAITEIWNGLVEKFKAFTQGIVDKLNELGFSFSDIGEVIKAVWDGLCSILAPMFEGAFQQIANVLSYAMDLILNIVDIFVGIFTGDWDQALSGIKGIFTSTWDFICNTFTNITNTLKGILDAFLGLFGTSWDEVWTSIKDFFVGVWNGISSFFSGIITGIQSTATAVWTAIKDFFVSIWQTISDVFTTVVNAISSFVSAAWEGIKNTVTTVMTAIQTAISMVWNAIQMAITTVVNAIKTVISAAWNAIKTTTSTVFNAVKSVVTSVWNGIKTEVMNVVNTMKSGISNGFNAIKSTISNIVNSIKNTISNVFNTIWSTVSGIVNKLKSVFNFSWSLPKIKLPHFSITGSFSLNPPSIPHFSVDWYKKAMSGGMILKDATIFGQSGGTLLGGGEAGDEAVVGVSSLRSMIQDAVQGAALSLSGDQPLINIEEMSVRSDDDIRKISQQLNTLLNAGRRAKGYI